MAISDLALSADYVLARCTEKGSNWSPSGIYG